MSKIVGFKMRKGLKPGDASLELEFTFPERFTHETLIETFTHAEQIIDRYLNQMRQPAAVTTETAQIPELDIEAIESLPWKGKAQEPSKPGSWGWIYGPAARMGIQQGAEKLAEAIETTADHKLQLGNMEYIFTKDKTFINRKPVKPESAK